MNKYNLYELEEKTSKQYLLNPYSGEWIKGLRIVVSEMGLIDFDETVPRTKDIFERIGSKGKREKYILISLAFVRTYFEIANINKVQLFRGMTTEGEVLEKTKTLISTSFNPEVGKAFSTIDLNDDITFSYLVKFVYPVENLFMIFFETKSFNEGYKEQEAVVFYRDKLYF